MITCAEILGFFGGGVSEEVEGERGLGKGRWRLRLRLR
jgi:hypothetical protein